MTAAVLLVLGGCEKASPTVPVKNGDWRYEIEIFQHDEFLRHRQRTAPCLVTVSGPEMIWQTLVNPADSICIIEGISDAGYLVTAEADGFYPGWNAYLLRPRRYGVQQFEINMYEQISSASHVDSIQCIVNNITPQVFVRCITSNILPTDGFRYCGAYFGLTPAVSPRYGDNVFSEYFYQTPGTDFALSADLCSVLRHVGLASGTRVYCTARIATYGGVENNSKLVTSFIMP